VEPKDAGQREIFSQGWKEATVLYNHQAGKVGVGRVSRWWEISKPWPLLRHRLEGHMQGENKGQNAEKRRRKKRGRGNGWEKERIN
jgi:hypothetical protein